jgi:indole-3-glycerol phosphate synthase
MNWRITMLEIAQIGAFVLALWIPFRMGRAGIRNPWPMLAGWFALVACGFLFVSITMFGAKAQDHELANSVMEGPGLLIGGVIASGAASIGRKGKTKFEIVKSQNILDTIVEQKKLEVAKLPERLIAAGDLRDAMLERGEQRNFLDALRNPGHAPRTTRHVPAVALIAEVKKASPSMGIICKDFDPVRIAKEYEAAGASCLSVLTDEKFFQGSLDYLRQIREAVKIPLLRKDFIIDERQILEAIEWGADAILLIVAILDDARLKRFHDLAIEAGLSVLVEVHDEAELDRALAIGAKLIGVNNRDLKTFKVDLATTERLAARLVESRESRVESQNSARGVSPSTLDPRPSTLLVAESGIHTHADVQRVAKCGAGAILVGESLVKQGNIGAKVRELLTGK